MAIVKKINVSEVVGSNPITGATGAVLPNSTIVLYQTTSTLWEMRMHDGVTDGGLPISGGSDGATGATGLGATGATGLTGNNGATGATGSPAVAGVVAKTISISDPVVSDTVTMYYIPTEIAISRVTSVIRGGSGVTFTIRHATDRSSTGTELVVGGITCNNTTTGLATTVFDNSALTTGEFVWLNVESVSGSVSELCVTIEVA